MLGDFSRNEASALSAAASDVGPLMEWSGRAPAPPAIEAGKGRQSEKGC